MVLDIPSTLQLPVLPSRPSDFPVHPAFDPPVIGNPASDWRLIPGSERPARAVVVEEPPPPPPAPPPESSSDDEPVIAQPEVVRGSWIGHLGRAAGTLVLPVFRFGKQYRTRKDGPVRMNGVVIGDVPAPTNIGAPTKLVLRPRLGKFEIPDVTAFVKVNDEIDVETIKVIVSKDLPTLDEFYGALPSVVAGGFKGVPAMKKMVHPCERSWPERPQLLEPQEIAWN
jgi:hypothetical protein